ncbi:MAG: hypothetical protein AB9880_07590 [Christensenellales bacterium]
MPPEGRHVAALIGAPCLVRKDRAGRAFFISDYPRRLTASAAGEAALRLTEAGWRVQCQDGLARVDWQEAAYQAFYEALPPPSLPAFHQADPAAWGLCRILLAHPAAYGAQDASLLHLALRLRLLNRREQLLTLLSQGLADALREGRSPPSHGARLLFWPAPDLTLKEAPCSSPITATASFSSRPPQGFGS